MNTEFFRKKYHFAVEFMAAMHYNKRSIPKWGRWYAVLNIVLVEPEIPQNCGNIARTCAATGSRLHLIRPLGFDISDRAMKRAGLDYWHLVHVADYEDLDAFFAQHPEAKDDLWLATTKAPRDYTQARFSPDCWLFFGKETAGLPEAFRLAHYDRCLRLPMREEARSLNLSNSVAILTYEALRQKVHWINGGLPEDGRGAMPDRGAADRETESLSAFLCDQLERLRRNLRRAREQELTPRQREILALYYDRGLKMPQIARKLGINRSTVSRAVKRAKERLYRCLRYAL